MRIRTTGVVALFALTLAASGCGGGGDEPATKESPKAAGGKLVIWADDKRTAALKPFASGTVAGGYRKAEARALLDVMDAGQ